MSSHDDMDEKVNAILEHQARYEQQPAAYSDEELSEVLIDIFGRTGSTNTYHGPREDYGGLLATLINQGLVTAQPHRFEHGSRLDLSLTDAGQEMRVERLLHDVDLSHRVMAEVARRALEPILAKSLDDPEVRRNTLHRARRLLAEYLAAVLDGSEAAYIEAGTDELETLTREEMAFLEETPDAHGLAAHAWRLQRAAADRFVDGT